MRLADAAGGRPLTIGTAGHVDHGKTALVAALTGRDTDRLAEEKRRGISIELGFALLELEGRRLSLVDVPGHERFVRTMVAGATGIDLFLLVVAADDGVMPQTREHMAVLRALGVEHGVLALTKCDLADSDARRLAVEECAALAPGLSPVAVSARTGEGLADLRRELARVADSVAARPPPHRQAEPLLHVDRVFTIAGAGTVVTGTLWSGRLERGQEVRLLPAGRRARVRGLEVHERRLDAVDAGQRVAVNLRGVSREDVEPGDALTSEGGSARATYRVDVELETGARGILDERRAQVHLGTRAAPARIVDLGEGRAQLRLERPLIACPGDRLVVRRIAPPDTLGGGRVAHASPRRHGPGGDPEPPPAPEAGTPRSLPASAEPSELALRLLAELRRDGLRPRPPVELAAAAGVERPAVERALAELVDSGRAVRLKPDVVYPADHYARIRDAVLASATASGSTTIAAVRDQLGVSRKYAQALLERMDGDKALRRDGDRHLPRATHRTSTTPE
jgi:selenocysteine-specific elongation factor